MSVCKKSDIDNWKKEGLFNLTEEPPKYHRKYWEIGFLLSTLSNYGLMQSGKKGIVFGCGKEATIPALAKLGVKITATDQPLKTGANSGWAKTNQYCFGLSIENVSFQEMDMNDINFESIDSDYDFLWSLCSLEHLGSLENSHQFIIQSMRTLKPGGIAVHTTEFNYYEDKSRNDPHNCIFSPSEFKKLFSRLKEHCHSPCPLDFEMGDSYEDKFVDMPPFSDDLHLKLFAENHYITSIGFTIKANNVKLL